ncbi:WxL domain-containing protein [Schleiferilactobacillus harbinensis]|uniref:WxL domain-containing protein n=1 Tax=Schleiferilactobacillus harbinensis TaxID=304207 RepID=UPI0039E7B8AD
MMIHHAKLLTETVLGSAALLLILPPVTVGAADTTGAAAGGVGPGDSGYNLSADTTVTATANYFAATTTAGAVAKSTAEFSVLGGALELTAVPDLNFGQVNAGTILNGGDQKLTNNTVTTPSDTAKVTSKNFSANDGNSGGALVIDDLRGTGAGWNLTTQLGASFTAPDAAPLTGITLSLNAPATAQIGNADTLKLAATGIGTKAAKVVTAPSGFGIGRTSWSLTGPDAAGLHFASQSVNVPANAIYQTDITWTLSTGA